MSIRTAIFVALTVASCGSSDRTSPATGAPGDGCAAYAAALADHSRGCFRSSVAEKAAQTEASALARCRTAIALEGSTATAEMFGACAIAFRSAACGHLPSCRLPPGKLANGASCMDDVQCESRLCNRTSVGCGVCEARVPIGARCTGDVCVDGARCDASLTCVATPRSPLGASCSNTLSGPFCEQGLFCDSTNTCSAPVRVGESCAAGLCAGAWTRCDPATRVCVVPKVAGEGEECGDETRAVCGPGLTCGDKPTTCFKLNVLPPGADCARDFSVCAWGECTAGRCPMVIADGAACATDGSFGICGPGASCADGKCQQPQQIVCK